MPERQIYWGSETSASYATRVDTDDNDRAILLETADGETVLLEWDNTENGGDGAWLFAESVEIDGNEAFHEGNESTIEHDNISGGTSGNPHEKSASNDHGNESHSERFATEEWVEAEATAYKSQGVESYDTKDDIPTDLPAGSLALATEEGILYVEDGN